MLRRIQELARSQLVQLSATMMLGIMVGLLLPIGREVPPVPFEARSSDPRGIRNNNPGNIVSTADQWVGKVGSDGKFVKFDTADNGLRALALLLKNYHTRGFQTINAIIGRWAPTNENDTSSYIGAVSNAMGVAPSTPLAKSPKTWMSLMKAIIRHENGVQPYSDARIQNAITRAGVT